MRLDPAPLCLRNDGGTLCRPPKTADKLVWRVCDVCGQRFTVDLLEVAIKSSWEALRLGYQPAELRPEGRVVLTRRWSHGVPYITVQPMSEERVKSMLNTFIRRRRERAEL
ncbi:hypothetical protein LCGC14_2267360 [marine sediment metagenome]|uniref:Uncharacterized protein n=1 Tax=marine sediment metagenome TaxID=412755 RepID=A0A0F9FSZ1_9ZZZZ